MFRGQSSSKLPLYQARRFGKFFKTASPKQKKAFGDNFRSTRVSRIFITGAISFLLLYSQPIFNLPFTQNFIVKADQPEQTETVRSNALPFVTQLPHPGVITTYFSSYHPGIDLATGLGMPIHPIADGTILTEGYDLTGYGLTVVIDHGYGYTSRYAHMGEIYVKKGQSITRDQIIGTVGLTGRTTGPHTHLEVTRDGVKINPLTILPPTRAYATPSDFQNQTPAKKPVIIKKTPVPTPTPTPTPEPTPPEQKDPQPPLSFLGLDKTISDEQFTTDLLSKVPATPSQTSIYQGGNINLPTLLSPIPHPTLLQNTATLSATLTLPTNQLTLLQP